MAPLGNVLLVVLQYRKTMSPASFNSRAARIVTPSGWYHAVYFSKHFFDEWATFNLHEYQCFIFNSSSVCFILSCPEKCLRGTGTHGKAQDLSGTFWNMSISNSHEHTPVSVSEGHGGQPQAVGALGPVA